MESEFKMTWKNLLVLCMGAGLSGGDSYCSGASEGARGEGEDSGSGDASWQEKQEGVKGVIA